MKPTLLAITFALVGCSLGAAQDSGELENSAVAWRWDLATGKLISSLHAKVGEASLTLTGECFQVVLGDGRTLKACDFKLRRPARTEVLAAEPDSPTLSHHSTGRQMVLEFSNAEEHLTAIWKASLREGSSYLRQALTLKASGSEVWVREIVLFDQPMPGAEREGLVDGSPVVAGKFFCGYEHPMAQNAVEPDGRVRCRLVRNAALKDGEALTQSLVLGLAPTGQTRRAFLGYLERERAHPYRPFLHYNSWYDIAWDKRKFDQAQSLEVIERFGRQLVAQRGVQMDSFLFDDGWDDNRSLWRFHAGFPNGFTPLKAAATRYHSGIGVWLSPFGGYDEARQQRLEYGSKYAYETNASGFSLAGPKYYRLFHDICLEMVRKYGVNQFKFDGLAAGAKANQNDLTRDGDAMLRLVAELRAAEPNLYINQTVGTWPSPFWLLSVDSTWRGGEDHSFQGQGTSCQQWMTYRDGQVYHNVVKRAPLYPLNSLMLHGIIYATNAARLQAMSDGDFSDQVRAFFGSGTQLQEMYLSPGRLNKRNWDDLAEAARWSRSNAEVLADSHWIGGDPGKGQVYGWASWSPRKGILVLRNPADKPMAFAGDIKAWLELPPGSPGAFRLRSPWKSAPDLPLLEISAGRQHTFNLGPFEVVVLEATPVAESDQSASAVSGASNPGRSSALQ